MIVGIYLCLVEAEYRHQPTIIRASVWNKCTTSMPEPLIPHNDIFSSWSKTLGGHMRGHVRVAILKSCLPPSNNTRRGARAGRIQVRATQNFCTTWCRSCGIYIHVTVVGRAVHRLRKTITVLLWCAGITTDNSTTRPVSVPALRLKRARFTLPCKLEQLNV